MYRMYDMKKQELEAIMKIIIFFLGILLFLSILNGKIAIFTVIGALACTYIFVHYTEKRYLKKQKVK